MATATPPPWLIAGDVAKELRADTLIPANMARFPWAGHLGIRLLDDVAAAVKAAGTTLVFTNTRAQTELWFQVARRLPRVRRRDRFHHGSLDPGCAEIEDRLRRPAALRHLHVEPGPGKFSPVDQGDPDRQSQGRGPACCSAALAAGRA
ncbi:MAG: hypothetical protein R2838_21975 [Caldilineaceae bacterium]